MGDVYIIYSHFEGTGGNPQMAAQLDARFNFTATYLYAAAIFVRRAFEIERGAGERLEDDRVTEYRGYVAAAIMQSCAALEAEIWSVTVHGPGHHLGSNQIGTNARDLLAWQVDSIDCKPVLERYALVLSLLTKEPFPRGGVLWEHADLLVTLRNALIHYKSEWAREMNPNKFPASLKKLRLPRPPFVSEQDLFFPNQCLSAACAGWAVNASFNFLTKFYELLGCRSPVSYIESKVASLTVPS